MQTEENKELFQKKFEGLLGDNYPAALRIFDEYGARYSHRVFVVLEHAAALDAGESDGEAATANEAKIVGMVLRMLKEHYYKHLCFQHPERRELLNDITTEELFDDIYLNILGIQPEPSW